MADKKLNVTPTSFVIFGAAGDLAWRKLIPSLFNLFMDGWLPDKFSVIGVGHRHKSDAEFYKRLHEGVRRFSRFDGTNEQWKEFQRHFEFIAGDVGEEELYTSLGKRLGEFETEWEIAASNRVFYLAMPPDAVEPIVHGLTKAGLNRDSDHARIVVEKPFGRDLESAKELNRVLLEKFEEKQIFRIDHFLGKETVQNIMAFRFANILFEPVWNRSYIDHVQITVAEQLGVEHRGHFYEKEGCLRDMIQNHLMQILCMVAMEPPVSFEDNEIRNRKVDVLHAIRPIPPEQVNKFAVRGQYGAGWMNGEQVVGYRQEPNVAEHSYTETFAAIKLYIDNWRWQDVPFYLRTGKRMAHQSSEVCIQFKPVPHQPFPFPSLLESQPNRLILAMQPEEGILLRFESKYPGPGMHLAPVLMQFFYKETFRKRPNDAYETLLLDIMRGDATLFMRADQAEAAWAVLENVLAVWGQIKPTDFPNYTAGSWGPEASETLIAQDGHSWVAPTPMQCRDDAPFCTVSMEGGA